MRKVFLSLLISLSAFAALAQNSIDCFTVVGGGGTSSAGAVALTATIGQPYAGLVNGGSSTINSGLWGSLATDALVDARELIVNGSFENVARTFVPDPNSVMSLPLGSTIIPGWKLVGADLLWGSINDG